MAVAQELIVFRKHIVPIGSKNGVNLEFESPEEFNPDTLEVFLSGLFLIKDIDFEILPDNKTFKILIEPNDFTRLNCAPLQKEQFSINYILC